MDHNVLRWMIVIVFSLAALVRNLEPGWLSFLVGRATSSAKGRRQSRELGDGGLR